MATTVKVTNLGSAEIRDSYGNQEFVLPPKKSVLVPQEATYLWFGHPDYLDADRFPLRTEEYERLRVRYGAYDDDEVWERNRPRVKVQDLEDNEIVTVLDDPQGEHLSPKPARNADVQLLEVELERQQAQIKLLLAELEVRKGEEKATTTPEDLPKDTPERASGPAAPRRTPPKAARE